MSVLRDVSVETRDMSDNCGQVQSPMTFSRGWIGQGNMSKQSRNIR